MKVLNIVKKFKKYLLFIVIFSILQIVTELFLPNIMSNIIDDGIVSGNSSFIIKECILMTVLSFASLGASIISLYFSSKFSSLFSYELRKKLYLKINKLSKIDIDKFGASTLITRSTNDVNHVTDMFSFGSRVIVIAPVMAVGAIIMAIVTEKSLAWIIFIAALLLILSIFIIFFTVYKKFALLQQLLDKLNAKTREILNGLKVIRAFNKESLFLNKFNKDNSDYKNLNLFLNRIMQLMEPMILIMINLATIGVIYFSLDKINVGNIEVGKMMAFIQYLTMILMSFTMLMIILIMIPKTIVSLKRIEEIYNHEENIKDKGIEELKDIKTIEFKNVSFRYPGAIEDTISNASFILEKNKTYGVIGSSGSGKSTILNLLLRFVEPTNGEVLINNKNIQNYTLSSLRNCISYTPQNPIIFKGSVKENLIFDDKYSEDEIYNALDIANIKDLILSKKEKLDYELESNIVNLSGGEKARINIARTILKKGSLYIFDDSFSAIDYITDKNIRENLKKLDNSIKIYITQRIDTVKSSDKILLFENGMLEGFDTYSKLKNNSEVFKEFILSQERGEDNEA